MITLLYSPIVMLLSAIICTIDYIGIITEVFPKYETHLFHNNVKKLYFNLNHG